MNNKKCPKSVYAFLTAMLVLIAVVLIILEIQVEIDKNQLIKECNQQITAQITEVRRTKTLYKVYYQYNVGGQKYTGRDDKSTAILNYKVGQTINIYINPENPSKSYIFKKTFGTASDVFVIICFGFLVYKVNVEKRKNYS